LLYLVPTPIGNLKDITLRALEVLKDVDMILAEDTRTSGNLLKHYEINARLSSFHLHNEHQVLNGVIQKLQDGQKIALISDAGTPGISDPGFLLVRECLRNDIKVECLPGATALIPALVDSGFPSDRFVFEGFLPQKKGRQTRIKSLVEETRTIILYESPHRLVKALTELGSFLGPERPAMVARELSKLHEEKKHGTLQELAKYFSEKTVKGEIVIVIEGYNPKKKDAEADDE
jgi:16S rRNA (cytidine1402-2'-O)-methyltransferase